MQKLCEHYGFFVCLFFLKEITEYKGQKGVLNVRYKATLCFVNTTGRQMP